MEENAEAGKLANKGATALLVESEPLCLFFRVFVFNICSNFGWHILRRGNQKGDRSEEIATLEGYGKTEDLLEDFDRSGSKGSRVLCEKS